MRIVRSITCALVVLLLAGVMAGCGGGDHSSGSSETADQGGGKAAPASKNTARSEAGGTGGGSEKKPSAPLPTGREVVHTAKLRVQAKDVEAAATKAKQLVTGAGGYVEQESTSSDPARSEIALKIPSDRYTDVLDQLSTQLGTKLSLSQEAEDVTGEVADVEARVRSAKATLESFRKLLDRANSVGEVIDVEQEIAERESDLEALQARQKSLTHRTQYATVTLTLGTKPLPPKKDDDSPGGFVGGLQSGWHAFTAFLGVAATVFGWLLPFLVTLAVIGLPVLAFRHRLRDRFSAGGASPGPDPEAEKAAVGAGEQRPQGPQQGPQGPPPPV